MTSPAQALQLNAAYAADPNVAPTQDYQQLLPNPSGVQNFIPQYVDVAANPLDPSMVKQRGAHVGQNATPTIVADLSKELLDVFGRGLLRSVPRAPWGQTFLRVTAVVDGGVAADSFTVAGAALLPAGTIIRTRGFKNAANNGTFVLVAGSTAGSLKVASGTLVAEAVAPAGSAQAEIIGFQCALADVEIDADGNIASTAQDLTVFGLQPGHRVYFRAGAHATAFGTLAVGLHFATIADTVTANLLPLKHRTFPIAAVAGDGKTIRLYFGVLYRNVPYGTADYLKEPAWWLETTDVNVDAGGAPVHNYAESAVINSFSLGLGVEAKIEATIAFLARRVKNAVAVADRLAGAANAYRPLSSALFHTSCSQMLVHRVLDATDDTLLVDGIKSATFAIAHNATPRKYIAGCGSEGANFGDIDPTLTLDTDYASAEVPRAIDDERTCRYEALMRNEQGAIAIDLPTGKLNDGNKTSAENQPTTQSLALMPFGDPANANIICCINVLAWLPLEDPS